MKLTLSQDAGGHQEAETHELVVDIDKDHDGEGISRWAAMTEFWSLISYQVGQRQQACSAKLVYAFCLVKPTLALQHSCFSGSAWYRVHVAPPPRALEMKGCARVAADLVFFLFHP